MSYDRPTVLVNGADLTDQVVPETLEYAESVRNGRTATLDLVLKGVAGSYEVEGGSAVEFWLPDDAAPLFQGLHVRTFPGHYAAGKWQYRIRCVGYEQVFGWRQLFTTFRGLTFAEAVDQILNDPEQGFPDNLLRAVSDPGDALTGDMPFYAVNGAWPADILDLISNLTGTIWRVVPSGADLALEFFKPFDTYGGFTLTEDNRAFKWSKFEPAINLETLVNQQTVRGSQAVLDSEETAYFRGDDLTSKFDLPTAPYNNTASVVLFDSFNGQPVNTSYWFETDAGGNHVYADGSGFVQFEPTGGNTAWVGLISKPLAERSSAPLMVADLTWVSAGEALIGLTAFNAVPTEYERFLEAGVYVNASGQVYGVAAGSLLGTTGLVLSDDTQYRFRFVLDRTAGCKIQYQTGDALYGRDWTTLFDSPLGSAATLGSAVVAKTGNFALASVKTTYPYLGLKLEVDRGDGFAEETVGIGDIDEDVDAVLIDGSVVAFFGSDPGPSSIPPKPDWQDDPDYKNIRVTYRRGVNILATASDQALITAVAALVGNGDTGVRQGALIVDESISTYAAAIARARTEIENRGNLIEQVYAETSRNTLLAAGVPLPVAGELARLDVTLPTVSYEIVRDVPVRQWALKAKTGANDFAVAVTAGYLSRGLRSVLQALLADGKVVSLSENQVIYQSKTASETLAMTDAASTLGSASTKRWGDSRNNRTFAVTSTANDEITVNAAALFETGDDVRVSSTGTLPTNLSAGTVYYIRKSSTTVFTLYTSRANAVAGGATGRVDLTVGTGSGVHTIRFNGWTYMRHKWGSFQPQIVVRGRGSLRVAGRRL